MTKEEILKKNNKPNGREVVTCYNIIHEDDALRAMQEYADQESNRLEKLVMPKIAVLYKQNEIPTDLDNGKLKHYLDWECEKSNLIDFIVEITEVLKIDSNFSE